MTASRASAPIDPPPAPPAEPRPPAQASTIWASPRGERFFAWTAGLGIVRGDGWAGGVAAGLAARMGVDPLIARGIFVVVALFGFPALFLYALAWALLPDLDGRIPLQEALRGNFDPALVGVAACVLLGLFPAPLAVLIGAPSLDSFLRPTGLLVALVCLGIVAGLIVLIVRAARVRPRAIDPRHPVATTPDQRTASAASDAPDSSALAPGSGPVVFADVEGVDASGFAASTPSLTISEPNEGEPNEGEPNAEDQAPGGPPAPEADAEYAAWREQHAAWKAQDEEWRRAQQDAARAARDQARRERQASGAAFTAEAAERRRIRRLTDPRTPFAYVAVVVGLAIVVGAVAALTGRGELAPAVGAFVAALILALGMVVAGILRRRSGFLAFATVLALLGGATAMAVPTAASIHLGSYRITNSAGSPQYPAEAPFLQPWGDVSVSIFNTGSHTTAIHIDKRAGAVWVNVDPAVALTLDVTAPANALEIVTAEGALLDPAMLQKASITTLPDGRTHLTGVLVSGTHEITTEQTLVIDQQSGWIRVDTIPLS